MKIEFFYRIIDERGVSMNFWPFFTLTNELIDFLFITGFVFLFYYVLERKIEKRADQLNEKNKKEFKQKLSAINYYLSLSLYGVLILNSLIEVNALIYLAAFIFVSLFYLLRNDISAYLLGYKRIARGTLAVNERVLINNRHEGKIVDVTMYDVTIEKKDGNIAVFEQTEIKEIEKYINEYVVLENNVVLSFREDPRRVEKALTELTIELNKKFNDRLKVSEDGKLIEPFVYSGITTLNSDYQGIQYTIKGKVLLKEYEELKRKVDREIAILCYEKNLRTPEYNVFFKTKLGGK